MRFERITDAAHEKYKQALDLYHISFPFHEQREAASQANILDDKEYFFNLIYDEDTFVGLFLCWETENFIYIEHFCILPEMRSRRYGQKTLKLLEQRGKNIILEIDPPIDIISARRKGFYERNGFAENPYPHIHPPYHMGNTGHQLVIMTYPAKITQEEYNLFNHYLECHIMAGACIAER